MPGTVVGLNDAKAVKKWAAHLTAEAFTKSYWNRSLVGSPNSSMPVQMLTDLEQGAGDQITFDLNAQLVGNGAEGDNTVAAEPLTFHSDNVYVDQKRHKVSTGGKMTQKRTLHNLRSVGRDRLADWWARYYDEQFQYYLSGARGITGGMVTPLNFTGRANNPLSPPDASHIVYGGNATSKATVTSTDIVDLSLIDKLVAKACTMNENPDVSLIQKIMIEGGEHFVLLLHDYQEYDLRTNLATGQWLDIQKAAAAAAGFKANIFKGGLGMYNNVILHKHPKVVRFNDYGAGGNVEASRALFIGEQAAVCAYGGAQKGSSRFSWFEEIVNSGNDLEITTSAIFGVKKATFNNLDYGVIAVDTAAAKPVGI